MKLLIDIGNTRLKWALARDGQLQQQGVVVHGGKPAGTLAQLPAASIEACWIAQVTGREQEAALQEAIRGQYGCASVFARSTAQWQGLRNAYREPERLGVDRWLAMVAVWQQHRGAACVVDAGTALTADVINANGHHLGGFIAAGLHTQQAAVLGATRFEFRQDTAYSSGLGQDTEACVRQGALFACLGATERARLLAGTEALGVLAGGDAASLHAHLHGSWQLRPALVLEGLLALSQES